MTTFSRWKNRAHIRWEESCWTWLEWGTGMLFLSSFLIPRLLCFRLLLFLSPPRSQPNLNPFSHACPLFAVSASPMPSPNTTASQQWLEGTNSGTGPHVQPTVLSQRWRWWWLCHPSWPSSQVVANLFYRWDGIFGAIVLEMLFASARHNLSGATQLALENAAWPHSIDFEAKFLADYSFFSPKLNDYRQ